MNIDDLSALAKRRGFFWPSAEIYGGAAGIYDYGDVGALLKRKFESLWLSFFVDTGRVCHLIEGSTILPEAPLVHSGHASRFNDIIVGCSKCHSFYRADVLLDDSKIEVSEGASAQEMDKLIKENKVKCPKCKSSAFSPSKTFNMMIDVALGPEKGDKGYLRPETAQSAYLNFFREYNILRKTLPFGLAVIGKAYRNEISPRQGLYRMRELTQAEVQLFFDPQTFDWDIGKVGEKTVNVQLYQKKQEKMKLNDLVKNHKIPRFYAWHIAMIDTFYREVLGVPEDKIRFLEKGGNEKAFYNKIHMDIEIEVESWGGFKEVGGLHYRGDYDLTQHTKGSQQDHSVTIDGRKFMPNVLELSFGVDRNLWMLIDVFFKKDDERTVLQIKPYLSPYQLAIFPLQKDEEINQMTDRIFKDLRPYFRIALDDSGSIGRRYARMDEIGTPFCVTVDYDSVNKESELYGTVTVRSRDDKKQVRIKTSELKSFVEKHTSFNPYGFWNFF
ncbi:MAG: glycine--tRNA ligase [Candidatus Micrarchaeales archaeon]